MKRIAIGSTLVAVSLFVIGLTNVAGVASSAQAGEQGQNPECSAATLEGEYLFTGTAERAPDDPPETYPRIFAGVYTFDGEGNLHALATDSRGGQIRYRRESRATYAVDSDCNGNVSFEGGNVNFDLFITRDGSEGHLIRYDEGTIATRYIKKR